MKKQIFFATTILAMVCAQDAVACQPNHIRRTFFQDSLDIEYLFEATLVASNIDLQLPEDAYRETAITHLINVRRVLRGPQSYEGQLLRVFSGGYPVLGMVRGDQVVVGLFDPDDYSSSDFAQDISKASDQSVMFQQPCGSDPFIAFDGPNGEIGKMLLEIFDGDGDPQVEAVVFDRYRMGQSGRTIPVSPPPIEQSPRPPIRP